MTIGMSAWCGASGPGNGRASSQWRDVTCPECNAKGMTWLRSLVWDMLQALPASREALAFAVRAGRLGVTDEQGRPLAMACAPGGQTGEAGTGHLIKLPREREPGRYRATAEHLSGEVDRLNGLLVECGNEIDRLKAERDRLVEGARALERVAGSHERALYAAWIDVRHGDPGDADEILAEQLDGFDGPQWNGHESGIEWLERTSEDAAAGKCPDSDGCGHTVSTEGAGDDA